MGMWLDREQLDLEDEGGVGADVGASTALGVGKFGGDEELPL